MNKSTFEIEDPNEPQEEKPIKHKAFVTTTLVAPYVSGALMLLQKKEIRRLGLDLKNFLQQKYCPINTYDNSEHR